jgi:hypothetical protein
MDQPRTLWTLASPLLSGLLLDVAIPTLAALATVGLFLLASL